MGNIQNYLNIKSFILCCQKQNKDFYKLKKYIFDNEAVTIIVTASLLVNYYSPSLNNNIF